VTLQVMSRSTSSWWPRTRASTHPWLRAPRRALAHTQTRQRLRRPRALRAAAARRDRLGPWPSSHHRPRRCPFQTSTTTPLAVASLCAEERPQPRSSSMAAC
jgi:hypothetical protein